jgi:hypothetical protein
MNNNTPVDSKSLYGQKIYDNEIASRKCYEKNPIKIIEGFGCSTNKIIKCLILFLFIILMFSLLNNKEEVYLDINLSSPYVSEKF